MELIDIRNTIISADATSLFKQTAVVGVTGLLNIIAKSIVKFSLFDNVDSAKDWLAS